jgi:hypothetical protein
MRVLLCDAEVRVGGGEKAHDGRGWVRGMLDAPFGWR